VPALLFLIAGVGAFALRKGAWSVVFGSSSLIIGAIYVGGFRLADKLSFVEKMEAPVNLTFEGITISKTINETLPIKQISENSSNNLAKLEFVGKIEGFKTGEDKIPLFDIQQQLNNIVNNHPYFPSRNCIVLMGSADKRMLRNAVMLLHESNTLLAKKRGYWVAEQVSNYISGLTEGYVEKYKPDISVFAVAPKHPSSKATDFDLASDRRVDIYVCDTNTDKTKTSEVKLPTSPG